MTPGNDILRLSATEQARLIASGQLERQALLALQLAAIRERNGAINAFTQLVEAPGSVSVPGSALDGASFAVKENIDVQGLASTSGLRALRAPPASADAPVVQRLKNGGLACLGKLNMHAVALGATNHNADFGDCRNPHRLSHTPGGSSGGSGAAVAAGLCSIALGTDTMGSVRVPAAYCGVVGFKPSFEVLPTPGVLPLSSLLDHVGLLARSVEDVTHAFALAREPESTVEAAPGAATASFNLALPADVAALGATPEVCAAFEAALPRLQRTGFRLHLLQDFRYPFSVTRRAGLQLCEAELRVTLDETLSRHRAEMPSDLLEMLDFIGRRSASQLAQALAAVVDAGRWLTRCIAPFDALLLPTTPQQAFAMDDPVPASQADFTAMANMSGAPAISVPLAVPAGALPIGIQLIGKRSRDDALLAAARQLEAAVR